MWLIVQCKLLHLDLVVPRTRLVPVHVKIKCACVLFCFCMQLIPDDMEFQSGDVPNYTTSDGSVCFFLHKWFLLFFSSSVNAS